MKQRTLALLLAAAMALTLVGGAALAAEGEAPDASAADSSAAQPDGSQSETPDAPGADGTGATDPQNGETPAEGEEPADGEEPTEGEEPAEGGEPEEEEYVPDAVGTVSFDNLGRRIREGNLNALALEEGIQAIEAIDYDEMAEDLREALNEIANQQWEMITNPMMNAIPGMGASMAASLDAQYDAVRQSFDDIKEGKLQRENADQVWMLENTQDQLVMAGETLYITLLDLETTKGSLDRQLAAMDRTLKELELRYELGHISSQTLKQTQAGRSTLVSSRQTLDTNISVLKTQLELFIGAELTGNIRLGGLPKVSDEELAAMDLEADLARAKENSYALYDAKLTLDEAYDQYKEDKGHLAETSKNYEYKIAAHQYESAKYSYNATVQDFELDFRTLYLQVKDYKQVLDAARTALAVEQSSYSAAQLKHEQGSLSDNALKEAEDKVAAARETVAGAEADLFAAYHNYRWAVDHGILN